MTVCGKDRITLTVVQMLPPAFLASGIVVATACDPSCSEYSHAFYGSVAASHVGP